MTLLAFAVPSTVWIDHRYTPTNCGGHAWQADAFTVIQQGLNAAAPGATVYVAPGHYEEQLVITKPVTLIGSWAPTMALPAENIYTVVTVPDALSGAPNPVILGDSSGVSLQGIAFQDWTTMAADAYGDSDEGSLTRGGIHPMSLLGLIHANPDAYWVWQNSYFGCIAPPRLFSLNVRMNDTPYASTLVTSGNFTSTHGGSLSINPYGGFLYYPATSYFGEDTFTYTLTGLGDTDTGTVSMHVLQIPPATTVVQNDDNGAVGVDLHGPATTGYPDGWSVTNDAPATFPVGTTTVHWWLRDPSMLTTTVTQQVTVTAAYKVTAVAGANGSVTPATQWVSPGGTASITATPNTGYVIDTWNLDGDDQYVDTDTFTITDVMAIHDVEVTFIPSYTVTSVAGTHGTIDPAGDQIVKSGSAVVFDAFPDVNYDVDAWIVEGITLQNGGLTFSLFDITANHTVEVTFIRSYEIISSAGDHGGINPDGYQWVNSGDDVTFTAFSDTGYEVDTWLLDGVVAQTGGSSYTLTDVTDDHTVIVTYRIQTFTVTGSAGENGSVSPTTQTVDFSDTAILTATPDTGCIVNTWSLDGMPMQTGGDTFLVPYVIDDHAVTVTFLQTYTVTGEAGDHGNIDPAGDQTVNSGADITFTAIPDPGYDVATWSVDGTEVQSGGTSFLQAAVSEDHTVLVSFVIQTFTVTAEAGDHGSINPDGDQTVEYGDGLNFTATPDEDYKVNTWSVDGVVIQTGGTTFSLAWVTSDHTVSVSFAPTVPLRIQAPPDVTITFGDPVTLGTPTVVDLVDPSPMVTNNAPMDYPVGMTAITWTASDSYANTAVATQYVTVRPINISINKSIRACAGALLDEAHECTVTLHVTAGGATVAGKTLSLYFNTSGWNYVGCTLPKFVNSGVVTPTRTVVTDTEGNATVTIVSGTLISHPCLVVAVAGDDLVSFNCDFAADTSLRRFPNPNFPYDIDWKLHDTGWLCDTSALFNPGAHIPAKVYVKFMKDPLLGDVDGNWYFVNNHNVQMKISSVQLTNGTVYENSLDIVQYAFFVDPLTGVHITARNSITLIDGAAQVELYAGDLINNIN